MFWFFFKFNDTSVFVSIHNTKTAGFFHWNFNNGNCCISIGFNMIIQHLCIIHLIDVVSGKDKNIFRIIVVNKINVLRNSICSSTINIQISVCFLTWWKYINTTVFCIQTPTSSCSNITIQKN